MSENNKIGWRFPELDGGAIDGFNDAGLQMFKSNPLQFLTRETIQNALDAAVDQETTVNFRMFNLNWLKFPKGPEFLKAIQSCLESYPDIKNSTEFFQNAVRVIKNNFISVLAIEDTGTSGLVGDEKEYRSHWMGLVKSSGLSAKLSDKAGSFGIGKNAPFAASQLRTVFYSTQLENGDNRFQGVARLVSHKTHQNGIDIFTHGTGYYGINGTQRIERLEDIPQEFRRDSKGTSIFIIGISSLVSKESYSEVVLKYAVRNFWLAIHHKKLKVAAGTALIDSSELLNFFASSGQKTNESYYYYSYVKLPDNLSFFKFERDLTTIGSCELYIMIDQDKPYPNKIAFMRNGMLVQEYSKKGISYQLAGVFLCKTDSGNDLLRRSEPPAHDKWDRNLPEPNSSKKMVKEIEEWINECINEINSRSIGSEEDLDVIDPDISIDATNGKTGGEGILAESGQSNGRGQLPPIAVTDGIKATKIPGKEGSGDGGNGDGPTDGPGEGEGKSPGQIPIQFRVIKSTTSKMTTLIIRTKEETMAKLNMEYIGEDIILPAKIQIAKDETGEPITFTGNNLNNLPLKGSYLPNRFDVEFDYAEFKSLKVTAYHA